METPSTVVALLLFQGSHSFSFSRLIAARDTLNEPFFSLSGTHSRTFFHSFCCRCTLTALLLFLLHCCRCALTALFVNSFFLLIVRRLFTGRSPDCYLVPLFVSPVGRWTALLFIVVNGKLPAKAIRLLICDPIASPCSPSHPWGQSMPILCCCGLFIDEVFIFFIHS